MKKTHRDFLSRAVNIAVTHRNEGSIVAALEGIRKSKSPILSFICDIIADARFYKMMEDSFLWKKLGVYSVTNLIDSIEESMWKRPERIEQFRNEFLSGWMTKYMFPLSTMELKQELRKISSLSREEIDRLAEADWSKRIERDLRAQEEEYFGEGVLDCTSGKRPNDMDDEYGAGGGVDGNRHSESPVPLKSYDRELLRLAMMIGRNGGESVVSRPGRFLRAGKSDIEGITVGHDLSSVLPAELALLASPTTEDLFYDRYSKNRLQVFASASEVKAKEAKRKTGPIIISVDTSGSMSGVPERMAKSLSLAICEIAQKRRRPVCLINYSDSVSIFILTDIRSQRKELMSFLSLSYGGGNNEERMFRFLFEKLPLSKKYMVFRDSFAGADLLVVSDFIWAPLSVDCEELLEKAREEGMRFYALGVGYGKAFDGDYRLPMEQGEVRMDGYGFFKKCDYQFMYDEGKEKCHEVRVLRETENVDYSKGKRICRRK